MKTSNLTSHYILLFNKHQFVCEGLPHYWSAERFWFFTQVGHVCAWINITSTEVNLLVDRATSWICRCSLACSGWRKGRWVYCDLLIWCTAVTHIKEVPSLLTTIFLCRLWCSTVWGCLFPMSLLPVTNQFVRRHKSACCSYTHTTRRDAKDCKEQIYKTLSAWS